MAMLSVSQIQRAEQKAQQDYLAIIRHSDADGDQAGLEEQTTYVHNQLLALETQLRRNKKIAAVVIGGSMVVIGFMMIGEESVTGRRVVQRILRKAKT